MDPVLVAILQSWTFDPLIIFPLLLTAGTYLRGWWHLRVRMPQRFNMWRLAAFQSGLLVLFLALASPLDAFSGLLLQVHMIQHMLLMMVVPPLLLLGLPALPLLRGLPQWVAKDGVGPVLAWPPVRQLGYQLTHPVACWLAFVVTNIAWHVPTLYELALRSEFWHEVQHLCFLGTALLFWWPVVQPWPSRAPWPRWALIPYLLLADMQNTALSAFLIFSERILYPTYATVPRLWGISVLADQAAAGALMWVPGSVVFLVPVGLLICQLLSPSRSSRARENVNALLEQRASSFPSHRVSTRYGDSHRRSVFLLLLAVGASLAGVRPVWSHHGGVVQLKEEAGPFLITVFTDPTPLQAGAVDVSVMVQDGDRGRPLLTAAVTVRVREHGTGRPPRVVPATRRQATNKLLYAALVNIPTPGLWELEVAVQHETQSAHVSCAMTVGPPGSIRYSFWPSLVVFPVMIVWVALHRRRRARRRPRGTRLIARGSGMWKKVDF